MNWLANTGLELVSVFYDWQNHIKTPLQELEMNEFARYFFGELGGYIRSHSAFCLCYVILLGGILTFIGSRIGDKYGGLYSIVVPYTYYILRYLKYVLIGFALTICFLWAASSPNIGYAVVPFAIVVPIIAIYYLVGREFKSWKSQGR